MSVITALTALLLAMGALLFVMARRERIAREMESTAPPARAVRAPRAVGRLAALVGGGMTEAEVLVIWTSSALIPVLFGILMGLGAASALLGALGAAAVPAWAVSRSRGRMRQFDEQLGETMPLIASNLRAGNSVTAAIAPVAENMEEPLRGEFARLAADVRAGTPLAEALDAMAARNGSRDLKLFSIAVKVSQQRGGSLAEITERVGETIRARTEIRRFIRSKTALNRFEAHFLTAMPVLIFIFLMGFSPTHREFYSSPAGWALLALCVLLDVTGFLVMAKMGDLEID